MKSSQLQILLGPIALIVLIAGAFIIAIQFILGRISPLNQDLSVSKEQENALAQKVATLTQVSSEHLNQSEIAYLALPDQNPAALVISQLKNLAAEQSLVLTSVSVTSSNNEGELSNAIIELKAEGAHQAAFSFMKNLENISPLVTIERSKVTTTSTGQAELQLSVQAYWSKFPEKLPALTEAISGLSDEEVNVLSQLSSLSRPTFSSLTPSASAEGRINPFAVGQ